MANQDYLSVELKLDFVVLLKMKMTRKQRNIFWKYSLRWFSLPITKLCLVSTSELNLHIWNANSQSFARAKSEAKMAAHGGKFWTSVPVLSTTLIFSFCLVRFRKHSQPWKNCTDEILLDQFYIIEYLKGFIIAAWPKNCPKLSEDGKLTVKKGRALSTFPK